MQPLADADALRAGAPVISAVGAVTSSLVSPNPPRVNDVQGAEAGDGGVAGGLEQDHLRLPGASARVGRVVASVVQIPSRRSPLSWVNDPAPNVLSTPFCVLVNCRNGARPGSRPERLSVTCALTFTVTGPSLTSTETGSVVTSAVGGVTSVESLWVLVAWECAVRAERGCPATVTTLFTTSGDDVPGVVA